MATHRRPTGRPAPPSADAEADSVETTTLLAVVPPKDSLVETAPSASVRSIFRAFWPDTAGFRVRLVLSLLLVGVPPLLAAAGIYLVKILIDDVLTPRDLNRFPVVAAAFLAVTVAEGVLSFADEYLNAWVAERFVLVLRSRVFDHLQGLSLTFFENHQLGDIVSRLSGDVSAIEEMMLSGLNQALTYLFQILFFGGALFFLDWRLALAALVAAPGFLLLARFFSRRIKDASRERRRRAGSITAVAQESLHNVALVQAYNQQRRESARFHRENLGSFTAQLLATKLEALFAPFTDLLEAIGMLAVVGIGVRELIAGRMTLGSLLVFLGYLTQLYGPISGAGHLANSIYSASAGAERILEVLGTEPDVCDPADPVPMPNVLGAVRVDRLSFRYPGSPLHTLREIAFRVDPGETVAVVGASGAGKSTLLRLLMRLHDPSSGAVRLDGVDTRSMRVADLRDNLAVVLQETLVFDGTVAENILWGRPDAAPSDVVAAAKAADAHQFILGLPGGYHTRIGQRGMMLSGGQRQRIALARAIIRDAPVLLLDEPTTGLDAAASQRVLAPLRRAMRGRTTIVISHNLLTVTDADRIVYLERGRVAGYGTHRELLETAPGYAELYRLHHPVVPRPVAAPTTTTPTTAAPGVAAPTNPPRPVPRPRPGTGPTEAGRTGTGPGNPPTNPPHPVPRPRPRPTPVPRPRPTPFPRPKPPAPPALRPAPAPGPTSGPRPAPAAWTRPAPSPLPRQRPEPAEQPEAPEQTARYSVETLPVAHGRLVAARRPAPAVRGVAAVRGEPASAAIPVPRGTPTARQRPAPSSVRTPPLSWLDDDPIAEESGEEPTFDWWSTDPPGSQHR
jgi:ABC-type multidrug transport system fused ATPase/permease subunit